MRGGDLESVYIRFFKKISVKAEYYCIIQENVSFLIASVSFAHFFVHVLKSDFCPLSSAAYKIKQENMGKK